MNEEKEINKKNKYANIYPEKAEPDLLLKITDVAVEVGMPVKWVFETTQTLGIEAEWDYFNNALIPHYQPAIVEALREELEGQLGIEEADEEVTNYAIAKIIGRSEGWTRQKINDLGFEPIRTEDYREEVVKTKKVYDKSVLIEIKKHSQAIKKAFGRLTISQIERATGVDHKRIKTVLAQRGIHPLKLRDLENGLTVMTYPPEAAEIVEESAKQRPKFGGDWLTKKAIATALGKTYGWVGRHIGEYQDLSEGRQDDSGVTRPHYPPHVLELMRQKVEELRKLKDKGDYLTVHDMSFALGKTWQWVKRKIKEYAIEAEKRLDKAGTPREHYSPEALKILEAVSEKERAAQQSVKLTDRTGPTKTTL